MLGRLNLSKLVLILLLLTINSCGQVMVYDSEISCPNGLRVLIKFARQQDVLAAIKKAAITKKRDGSSENYTVIRLPGTGSLSNTRSLRIEKMSPEESLKCRVKETQLGMFSRAYVKKFTE